MLSIRELRQAKFLSQEALARALDVSLSAVQQWESGNRTPSGASILRIAAFFQVAPESIVVPEPKEKTA